MTADESFCARCARHTTTCCQWREIYVTPGDVERIVAFSGGRDFFEFSRPSDPSYGDQDHDAAWASCVFRADGTRRVLSRWPDGACFFLGAQGCALPAEVRPLVCRLHPFD
jgi:Fe-S-cluster containining protein